jgi:hypothetical protein
MESQKKKRPPGRERCKWMENIKMEYLEMG